MLLSRSLAFGSSCASTRLCSSMIIWRVAIEVQAQKLANKFMLQSLDHMLQAGAGFGLVKFFFHQSSMQGIEGT